MTALVLTVRDARPAAPGALPRPLGEVAARALFGGLAGLVMPVSPALRPPASAELLGGERHLTDLSATVFEGSPITSLVVSAFSQPAAPTAFWCAVGVALPRRGRLERQPWLRFGATADALVPLASIVNAGADLQLRFGLAGAPFVPPPARDQGGPIDQAWAEAADLALSELALAIRRLADDGLTSALHVEGASEAVVLRLERALRGVPGLVVEAGQELLSVLSERPGRCVDCRHANQGTFDLQFEGLLACTLVGSKLGRLDSVCDAKVTHDGADLYAFEPYDGANCTWATSRRLRFTSSRRR